MALFKYYFMSALICGVLVLGQPADPPTTQASKIIDVNPTTTEVPLTTTDPTTTSTTPPTTTSTTPPTTTSTTPSTTTSTTPPTTTSTTPPTTTSTTPSTTTSTTTAAPPTPVKPIGPPDQGLWSYTNDKNETCVIVQFAAQLNVTYPGKDSAKLLHAILNVPANATVMGGNCGDVEQRLTIGWPAPVVFDMNNSLTVVFVKNDTTNTYELKTLNATIVSSMLPNITNVASVDLYHGMEWQTPLSSSYRCVAPTELKMVSADESSIAATLTISRMQEEAFRTAAGNGFSAARDCAGGDIPDAVPIAVGCALGGMVVVVLIAYLVARRRSAARGYLSM